ncbi:MAG TPA: N-acetylglucosamine-6-phosphate deacetylase [Vicinamibacteria bacterium]|nr:N-acetylglucosamine-6-phosphate deacetylase [Vicinamibacteria bacterium]
MATGSTRAPDPDAARFAVRGRLVLDRGLVPGAVVVEGGRIAEVVLEPAPAALPPTVHDAAIVSPGFIDLQVNGGFGVEVGERADAIARLAARLPATGVTAFLPTLVSSAAEVYPRACQAFLASRGAAGALPLGLHLEGPFLSLRRAGAHRTSAIENASPAVWDPFLEHDALRLVTLAPELEGALEHIQRLRQQRVVVSLGHTDASYEEFRRGIDAGATMVTHLFNAMSGFRPRAPGAVGAALLDERVTVGVIADGVHFHPASLRLAVRAKGLDKVALVTDAIAGAGMEPGRYQLGGQDILVKDGQARLPDGTLAGSVLSLDEAVRNVVSWAETGVGEACRMASEVPARLLGLRSKGRLAVGCDADLVLLDDVLRVRATFREGRSLYRAT